MRLTAPGLATALGPWASGRGPLYDQLALALRSLIERGEVPAGARLPAERTLGTALHVSRTTVVAAYRRLRMEGLLASRRGSGTYVAGEPRGRPPEPPFPALPQWSPAGVRSLIGVAAGAIDLASTTIGDEGAITAEILAAGTATLARALGSSGYVPFGLPELRVAIAAHLSRSGTPTNADEILVTGGGQQALTLLAEWLLEPGACAAVQDPTYAGALDVFGRQGAQLVGLPVDPAVDLGQALELVTAGRDVRLAYVISTCHNPTGAIMPARQRRELLAAATRRGLYVVDDETLAALAPDEAPSPGLATLDDSGSVVTVGSLSKSCWAGLRIGWIRARPEVIDRLVRVKTVDDLSTSLPSQALAVAVLAEFERIVARRMSQLAERRAFVLELLARQLPEWQIASPPGGASLWVRLPGVDALRFAQLALRHGVSLLPGSQLSVSRSFADHVRIQLLQPREDLEEGVRRLAMAWSDHHGRERPEVRDLRVVA